jgi:hypothetical protein
MALPALDFQAIDALAKEAIDLYGSPATYTFHEGGTLQVKTVVYKENNTEQIQLDFDQDIAKALLNPAEFTNRMPERFDNITVDIGGFKKTYTVEGVHPIFAETVLPMLIVELRAN